MFAIEAAIKILGYTFLGYLKNKWNVFDFMLVIVSFVDIVLTKAEVVDPGTLSIFKVLRLVSYSSNSLSLSICYNIRLHITVYIFLKNTKSLLFIAVLHPTYSSSNVLNYNMI